MVLDVDFYTVLSTVNNIRSVLLDQWKVKHSTFNVNTLLFDSENKIRFLKVNLNFVLVLRINIFLLSFIFIFLFMFSFLLMQDGLTISH